MKIIAGGELKGYPEMLEAARRIATNRLVECAEKMGQMRLLEFVLLHLPSWPPQQR